MTGGVVRRDGLREAVTKLRDELLEKVEEIDRAEVNGTLAAGEWHERDAVSMIVDALTRRLDAVPDVPPTEDDWREAARYYEDDPSLLVGLAAPVPVVPPDPPAVDDAGDLRYRMALIISVTERESRRRDPMADECLAAADALLSSGVLVAAADVKAQARASLAAEFRAEADPSMSGIWREACDLLDSIARRPDRAVSEREGTT